MGGGEGGLINTRDSLITWPFAEACGLNPPISRPQIAATE